jgi:hypothetical protein
MEIQKEDVRGLYVGKELLCMNCVSDEDLNDAELDNMLTVDQVEKKTAEGAFIFCDRCKKRIKA